MRIVGDFVDSATYFFKVIEGLIGASKHSKLDISTRDQHRIIVLLECAEPIDCASLQCDDIFSKGQNGDYVGNKGADNKQACPHDGCDVESSMHFECCGNGNGRDKQ